MLMLQEISAILVFALHILLLLMLLQMLPYITSTDAAADPAADALVMLRYFQRCIPSVNRAVTTYNRSNLILRILEATLPSAAEAPTSTVPQFRDSADPLLCRLAFGYTLSQWMFAGENTRLFLENCNPFNRQTNACYLAWEHQPDGMELMCMYNWFVYKCALCAVQRIRLTVTTLLPTMTQTKVWMAICFLAQITGLVLF
jgi:hypothetical protein